MSSKNTPNVDKLTAELKAFKILDESWFKEKTKLQMEKKLKQFKKESADFEKKRLEDARALKKYDSTTNILEERLNCDTNFSNRQPFDYYLVFDAEATCDKDSGFDYENEIIEFPVILIQGKEMKIIDEFHRFCRPTIHPKLSEFCSSLTGIGQETVDAADPFPVVWKDFIEWLSKYDQAPFKETLFCTGMFIAK